jgi:hypothetical protein
VDRYSLRQNLDHLLTIYESRRDPKTSLPLAGDQNLPPPCGEGQGVGLSPECPPTHEGGRGWGSRLTLSPPCEERSSRAAPRPHATADPYATPMLS